MSTPLADAISVVYAAFAPVPKPGWIDHCPCCMDDDEVTSLLRMPVREISAEHLSNYASTVFLTVGAAADYRYFLPRILELSAIDPSRWPHAEIIGRGLRDAEWLTWDAREQDAITQLYTAKFEEILARQDLSDLDSWLCATAISGLDVAPFLSALEAIPAATLDFYTRNSDPHYGIQLRNEFWSYSSTGAKQVLDWFYSPSVSGLILESYGVDLHRIGKPAS